MIVSDLYAAQRGCCFYCRRRLEREAYRPKGRARGGWTRDHVLPQCLGGVNFRNVVLACEPCNTRKGRRMPTEDERVRLAELYRTLGRSGWLPTRGGGG